MHAARTSKVSGKGTQRPLAATNLPFSSLKFDDCGGAGSVQRLAQRNIDGFGGRWNYGELGSEWGSEFGVVPVFGGARMRSRHKRLGSIGLRLAKRRLSGTFFLILVPLGTI